MRLDAYTPADPTLQCWDGGAAELRLDGELKAYLTCVVLEMRFPTRGPWFWYILVWPDGFKEYPQEDYGPEWDAVRELDAGYFIGPARPSTEYRSRFLGLDLGVARRSSPNEVTYDVAWLPPTEAAAVWERFNLTREDF